MIRAILVDDEPIALAYLEQMLKELMDIDVVSACTDPVEAMEEIKIYTPDVVFLDIDMPELDGMRMAERISAHSPDTKIVFVTAYRDYAMEAFAFPALDYVLKPLQRQRLAVTVGRLRELFENRSERGETRPEARPLQIRCFGRLRFEWEEQQEQPLRWRTARAEELFAYLLHHRGGFVSKETLIELFWPTNDNNKASTSLYNAIYQIRKMLGEHHVALRHLKINGRLGYLLGMRNAVIDVEQWEDGIRGLGPVQAHNREEHRRMIDLYTGDYFAEHDYLWAETERQRLRMIYVDHAVEVARSYSQDGMTADAVTIYRRIVERQPYFEEAHLELMRAYERLGERSAVVEQFRAMRRLLKEELGLEVSEHIVEWYEQWRKYGEG